LAYLRFYSVLELLSVECNFLGRLYSPFGFAHGVLFLWLHKLVGLSPTLSATVRRRDLDRGLCGFLTGFTYVLGVCSDVGTVHGKVILLICGFFSVCLGYPYLVSEVLNERGEFGVIILVLLHSLFSFCGIWGVCFSQLLIHYFCFRDGGTEKGGGERHVDSGSERVTELCRILSLDLTRLRTVISEDVLDEVGTCAQGASERQEVRRMALVGDRVMALAISRRAARESWLVGVASDVSQTLLTNAAFAIWFDRHLSGLYPCMRGRAEKRKGTLVESLVGIAYTTGGCTVDEVETFVFSKVAIALGRRYTTAGESVDIV